MVSSRGREELTWQGQDQGRQDRERLGQFPEKYKEEFLFPLQFTYSH